MNFLEKIELLNKIYKEEINEDGAGAGTGGAMAVGSFVGGTTSADVGGTDTTPGSARHTNLFGNNKKRKTKMIRRVWPWSITPKKESKGILDPNNFNKIN